jgi:hypothetical protein
MEDFSFPKYEKGKDLSLPLTGVRLRYRTATELLVSCCVTDRCLLRTAG